MAGVGKVWTARVKGLIGYTSEDWMKKLQNIVCPVTRSRVSKIVWWDYDREGCDLSIIKTLWMGVGVDTRVDTGVVRHELEKLGYGAKAKGRSTPPKCLSGNKGKGKKHERLHKGVA